MVIYCDELCVELALFNTHHERPRGNGAQVWRPQPSTLGRTLVFLLSLLSILKMRKLRLRGSKEFSQSHWAGYQQVPLLEARLPGCVLLRRLLPDHWVSYIPCTGISEWSWAAGLGRWQESGRSGSLGCQSHTGVLQPPGPSYMVHHSPPTSQRRKQGSATRSRWIPPLHNSPRERPWHRAWRFYRQEWYWHPRHFNYEQWEGPGHLPMLCPFEKEESVPKELL